MSGVGLAGMSLAEAYAMRALHKEKMKKMEKQKGANDVVADENETPSGCFFWVSKKKTASSKVSSAECEEKLQLDAKLGL
ncbi:hypothetical protein Patl1_08464 [Pistacia atlantica]|uniref:Uncharacterized protein n=1 Tax=Pistacia atlantica TaxID=434234 RepID=A0ACC1AG06_9ROSI|nr:hypothetical protein Patl1_08464 [Pistacia atlantica]